MIPKDDVKRLIAEAVMRQENPGLLLEIYWQILKWEGRMYQRIRARWIQQENRQMKLFVNSDFKERSQ